MSSFDEILDQVPVSQLAQQFGVDESAITEATQSALPALLGGLQANAADPAGADSIMAALSQHQGEVPTDVSAVDASDGERIVGHIFGDNTDQVVSQLGGLGGGAAGGLVKKLLPMLAPIVLSWLAGKMSGGGLGNILGGGGESNQGATTDGPLFPGGQGAQSTGTQAPAGSDAGAAAPAGQGGGLQDILGQVLGGVSGGGGGDILGGILGGLLGGGRR